MEGMQEGSWEEQKGRPSPDFHLEDRKDPVEVRIEQVGWDSALEEFRDKFNENRDDSESRRQLDLAITLNEKRLKSLRDMLSH